MLFLPASSRRLQLLLPVSALFGTLGDKPRSLIPPISKKGASVVLQ
jgi:hypothetical protein